jgi:hypothetical protein
MQPAEGLDIRNCTKTGHSSSPVLDGPSAATPNLRFPDEPKFGLPNSELLARLVGWGWVEELTCALSPHLLPLREGIGIYTR